MNMISGRINRKNHNQFNLWLRQREVSELRQTIAHLGMSLQNVAYHKSQAY